MAAPDCQSGGTGITVTACAMNPGARPRGPRRRPVRPGGSVADPIPLRAVDEVTVTTLVDNFFDALLVSEGDIIRPPFGTGMVTAPQFTGGRTRAGLRAEHGFSALVTVREGGTRSTLLFDTGVSPDGMAVNAERLGVDVGDIRAVVLSHGHFDHAGGFDGLTRLRGRIRPAAHRAPRSLDPPPVRAARRRTVRDAHRLPGRPGPGRVSR